MNTKPTNKTHALITPEHFRRRAVVYCRKAGADRNISSMVYQRSLADVARSYGWTDTLIEVIDEDWEKSGLSRVERRGLQRLEKMIEADQVGAVLVTDVSRLWRQAMEFERFRLRAALHNTLLYTDERFIDPARANDLIVSQIVSLRDRWLATQKSKRASEKVSHWPTKAKGKMNMAKIINFPTLCKLSEDQKNELVMQVLELREKMNSIVELISDQQQTEDSRQRLYNELMAVQSMMANAGEVLRSAYTRQKNSV